MGGLVGAIDRLLTLVVASARWLALPLVAILFLQWPLRDLVKAWSREANDLGQCIFALYVAVAVTAATRGRSHLATDAVAHRYRRATRQRLERLLCVFGLAPWALFLLVSGFSALVNSLRQLEAFPDTSNPGYFLIRFAGFLLAALVLTKAVADILRRQPDEPA